MPIAVTEHRGKVVYLTATGLAMVEECVAGATATYGFTFDKIRGYRGESPREIGLAVGTEVDFKAEGEIVQEVSIPGSKYQAAPA